MRPYLFPFACLTCRKSFRRTSAPEVSELTCPHCGGRAVRLNRKFKAPPRDDLTQWEKVRLLVEHGFRFATVYDEDGYSVPYPATLAEARAFVTRFRPKAPSGVSLKRRRDDPARS